MHVTLKKTTETICILWPEAAFGWAPVINKLWLIIIIPPDPAAQFLYKTIRYVLEIANICVPLRSRRKVVTVEL